MPVVVDQEVCIGCETCVSTCPVESLKMNENGKSQEDPDTCIDCGACIPVCPVTAISEM